MMRPSAKRATITAIATPMRLKGMFPPRRAVTLRTDRRRRFRKRHELAPTRAVVRAVIWADIPRMAAEPMTTFARSRFSGKRGGLGCWRFMAIASSGARRALAGVSFPLCRMRETERLAQPQAAEPFLNSTIACSRLVGDPRLLLSYAAK